MLTGKTRIRVSRIIAAMGLAFLTAAPAYQCADLGDAPALCLLPLGVPVCASETVASGDDSGSDGDSGSDSGTPAVSIPVTVQTGTLTIAGTGPAATYTQAAAITAVNTDSSFLIFQSRHNSARPPGSAVRGRIANSTTVEFDKVTNETSTMTIRWYVVEYPSAYVKVQTGVNNRAANPVTQAITAVSALNRAFTLQSQTAASGDNTWNNDDASTVSLSATGTVRINADGANAGHDTRWQVIEYLDATYHADVQTATTSLTGGTLSTNVVLPTAVDTSRTISLVSLNTDGDGADVGSRLLRSRLSSTTNIVVERAIGGNADDMAEIHVQSIEFKDGSTVQSGTATFAAGIAQQNIAITSVDTTKAVALISGQSGAGQTMGMSDYNADDIPGVCAVTTTLTATQLTLDRDQTGGSCSVAWYVIKFGTD